MHLVGLLRRSLVVLLLVCALPASGADKAKAQAMPQVTSPVTDALGVVPAERKAALESRLEQLAEERDLHIGIVLVASTKPDSLEAYGAKVVGAWSRGVTDGKDGVLLLIAKEDGQVFIDVGKGRGVMPYKDALNVVVTVMSPLLRDGDYATAFEAGVDALISAYNAATKPQVQPVEAPAPTTSNVATVSDHHWVLALVAATVVVRLLGWVVGRGLAGGLGSGAVFFLAWTMTGLTWVGVVCAALVFPVALGGRPGKSQKILGRPSATAGGTVGASGDWLR
jgi:uncharacterized protein